MAYSSIGESMRFSGARPLKPTLVLFVIRFSDYVYVSVIVIALSWEHIRSDALLNRSATQTCVHMRVAGRRCPLRKPNGKMGTFFWIILNWYGHIWLLI